MMAWAAAGRRGRGIRKRGKRRQRWARHHRHQSHRRQTREQQARVHQMWMAPPGHHHRRQTQRRARRGAATAARRAARRQTLQKQGRLQSFPPRPTRQTRAPGSRPTQTRGRCPLQRACRHHTGAHQSHCPHAQTRAQRHRQSRQACCLRQRGARSRREAGQTRAPARQMGPARRRGARQRRQNQTWGGGVSVRACVGECQSHAHRESQQALS